MEFSGWRDRINHRNDITSRITHLTNGKTAEEAFDNLLSMLESKRIKGGHGFINGDDAVVCLQEAPLNSISENLIYERMLREANGSNHYRYRAFGLRFAKIFVYKHGGRPVIYGQASELRKILPKDEWWRIVDLQLDSIDNIIDWSHEREWRIKGDLEFNYSQTEVIVPSRTYYKKFVRYCLDNNKQEILEGINGIITLDSVYC